MNNNALEILLKQLDFTEKQIQIYLIVLKFGQLSPQEIASYSKINRSTVYAVCSDLASKGVIREDLADTSKIYVALPPIELQKLFQKEEKELQLKKAKINSAIAELEKVAKDTKYVIPKINFIPEEEVGDYMQKRTEAWEQSMENYDHTWWGFQSPSFVEEYHDWIKWYWNRADQKMHLKMFGNASGRELEIKDDFKQRSLKYLDTKHNFTSTLWILGDYLVIIQASKKPFYLYELHEAELTKNLRFMFQELWKREL